ncbi:hypothetical protein NL676_021186 [Syzygium grande]|nr:hypothetical protein NL676_021186 [Syzygium grande]
MPLLGDHRNISTPGRNRPQQQNLETVLAQRRRTRAENRHLDRMRLSGERREKSSDEDSGWSSSLAHFLLQSCSASVNSLRRGERTIGRGSPSLKSISISPPSPWTPSNLPATALDGNPSTFFESWRLIQAIGRANARNPILKPQLRRLVDWGFPGALKISSSEEAAGGE